MTLSMSGGSRSYVARELGFAIEDVRALLALAELGQGSCAQVEKLASAHLKSVKAKIKDLARLERILARSVVRCRAGTSPTCPVLDMLKS